MTLYLARDDGSGSFFPDRGGIDLIAISNMDSGYGEVDDPADPKGIRITYTRSDPGIPAQRLDTLVNDPTLSDDIVILPVEASFLLTDGTPISSVAGVALPVGNSNNPTTSDIATFYDTTDCSGEGWCVFDEDGGEITFPSSAILYHELAHCFHFATGVTTTEPLAQADENDMRDQLGIEHRDVNNHSGGCGGCPTNCCVVASITTGSPFSPEVNELRAVRDHLLRRNRLGADFCDRLLADYYGFSPEVCRLLAERPDLVPWVRERLVVPLLFALQLVRRFGEGPQEPGALGRLVAEHLADPRAAGWRLPQPATLRLLRTALAAGEPVALPVGLTGLPASLARLETRLLQGLASPSVRWGMLEPLAIWVEGAGAVARGVPPEAAGERLYARLVAWAGRFPLSQVWEELSPAEARTALGELADRLLHPRQARVALAERLTALRPDLAPALGAWVEEAKPTYASKEVAS